MKWDSIRKEWLSIEEQIVTLLPDGGKLSEFRIRFHRGRLKHMGQRVSIASGARLFSPQGITIGDDVGIGRGTMIDASDGGIIELGNGIGIGPYCVLRAADHGFDDPEVPFRLQKHVPGRIVIEDDVWLGSHVVVTRDVRIGRGAVIGAHSVVTKNIPPFAVAVGVPARVISTRGDKRQARSLEI